MRVAHATQFRTGGDAGLIHLLSPRAARLIRGGSEADSRVWMKEGLYEQTVDIFYDIALIAH